MVTKILKNTFIGGELSNKMQNRFDFSKYSSSAKYIENFNLQKEGNISFRDGSFYIDNLNIDNDTIKKVRLLEWIKNETTIYLLVFSNKLLKIYSNFVLLTTLETPYDLENIKNIQIDYCGNNLYIVDGVHTPYFLNNIGNNFTLKFADFSENDGTPPWVDGGIGGEYVVKDGKIDLQFQGSFVLVGLKYIGKIQTLNFNFDNQQGQNSCDLKKSINKINIFFYNTVSCKVGTNPYKLDYKYISPSSILGKVPTIFNGVSTFTVMDTPQQDKSLFFYKDDCSPCTIQFINIHINYA